MIPFLGTLVPEAFRVCGDQFPDTGGAGRVPALACADGRLVFGRQTLPLALVCGHTVAEATRTVTEAPFRFIGTVLEPVIYTDVALDSATVTHPEAAMGASAPTVEDSYASEYDRRGQWNASVSYVEAKTLLTCANTLQEKLQAWHGSHVVPGTLPDIGRTSFTVPSGGRPTLSAAGDVTLEWTEDRLSELFMTYSWIANGVTLARTRLILRKTLANHVRWLGFPAGADPWFLPVTLAAENPGTFRVVLRLLLACDRESPPTNDRLFEDPVAIPGSFSGDKSLRLTLTLSTTAARPIASANLRLPCLGGALFLATIESVDYIPATGVHDPIDLTIPGTSDFKRHWRRSSGPGLLRLTLHCSEMTR